MRTRVRSSHATQLLYRYCLWRVRHLTHPCASFPAAGCTELYPFSDYEYCVEVQMCGASCTNGAAALRTGAFAVLAVVSGALAAAWGRPT